MGDWSAWGFSWSILFGVAGLIWFKVGKQSSSPLAMGSGVALLVYPYFISNSWAIFLVGTLLALLPWVPDYVLPLFFPKDTP